MKIDRLGILLKQKQKLFHTGDLALLWGISNNSTLYTTISRYIKKKILFPIHKGLYSVVLPDELNSYTLGIGFLHRFAYISCETILVKAGIIMQNIYPITLVSDVSRSFVLYNKMYLCRKLKLEYLHNTVGILESDGILTAVVERAIADLLYFNPHYHFDNKDRVDWDKVKFIRKEIGYDSG
ncbi:hypothetical protein HYT02_02145 [Candidatus Gottesmanbacteria bacterium]|nr:hypothetical protein [Candidatus Gottesmanbacteria bacterium]